MDIQLFEGEEIVVELSRVTRIMTSRTRRSGKIKRGLKQTRKANKIILTNKRIVEIYKPCCACGRSICFNTLLGDIKEIGYLCVSRCCGKDYIFYSFKTDLKQTKFGIKVKKGMANAFLDCFTAQVELSRRN